jgi:dTDP-4-amino-4,6-dideoxygalactose transaminase
MEPIKMVDLPRQQKLIRKQIDHAIAEVLNNCDYILGDKVIEFEQKIAAFCQAKFAVSCANGTDALTLFLKAKGVSSNDAVFVPAFTFTATAEAVVLAGGNPFFVDVLPDTFNIDPNSLEAAINIAKKNKLRPVGIIPVDLFGLPADYLDLWKIATSNDLWVLCDSAQSFGASYNHQKVGTLGHATATSFFPSKPLGCYGDGGCVFTNDVHLMEIIQSMRCHGAGVTNGVLDKYNNIRIGVNSRLDTIQATILLEKLKIFPQELILRNNVANLYNNLLKNIDSILLPYISDSDKGIISSWAQYTIKLNTNRITNNELQLALEKSGIPTIVYYSKPVSSHLPYANFYKTDLTVANKLSNTVLSLPMHPYLSITNIEYIVDKLQGILCAV